MNSESRQALIKSLQDVIDVQCSDGNWNHNPYMHGLANGLLLAIHMVRDDPANTSPDYMEAPTMWLEDIELMEKFNNSEVIYHTKRRK